MQYRASFYNALAVGIVFGGCMYVGCDSGVTTTTMSGQSVTITNGSGYHPACNGGVRDGFCNALGADPETCDCLDCVDTAFCKNLCKNDGTCKPTEGEDCTCKDCIGHSVPDGNGGMTTCYQPTTSAGPGGGGSGPSSTVASTSKATTAATTNNTTAATTNNTTAATTNNTTAATTAASTSSATTAATTGTGG